MEINVEQSKLAKALSVVSRAVMGNKATLPILNSVLIRAVSGKVTLTTTNLDMAIVDFLPTSSSKDGEIAVPAKLLTEFVSNLPKGEVRISGNESKAMIVSGKYKSTINSNDPADFPELPEINEKDAVTFRMGIDEFRVGINEVKIASSSDTTRPALTGIYFNTYNGDLYIAATDGYRLAEREFVKKVKSEVKAIVPTSSLNDVISAISDDMEEIEILFDESQVRFRFGEIEVTSKLIDASFPDYRRLIPEKNESEVILKKSELSRIVKLAALFAREVGGSIICEANSEAGVFAVSSIANEYGENTSEIDAEVLTDGKVTLNSKYLIDVINVLEEESMVFGISGKLSPVVIRNDNLNKYTHIIMPLKS